MGPNFRCSVMNLDVGFFLPGSDFPLVSRLPTKHMSFFHTTCVSSHHPTDLMLPLGSLDSSCPKNG